MDSGVLIAKDEDISRIVLFYKLTELLRDNTKEMLGILEDNF